MKKKVKLQRKERKGYLSYVLEISAKVTSFFHPVLCMSIESNLEAPSGVGGREGRTDGRQEGRKKERKKRKKEGKKGEKKERRREEAKETHVGLACKSANDKYGSWMV